MSILPSSSFLTASGGGFPLALRKHILDGALLAIAYKRRRAVHEQSLRPRLTDT
jgi:hypothetical protein